MREHVEKLLEEGKVDAVLGQRNLGGFPFPFIYTKENISDTAEDFVAGMRYPMPKIFLAMHRDNPDKTFGVVVRGCEERALNEMLKWNQIEADKVVKLGYACSQTQAEACECREPYPTEVLLGDKVDPVAKSERVAEVDELDLGARLDWWKSHFNRCMRCYACRDVCPVCFCKECSLEEPDLIPTEMLPPDMTFHLVRAVHMAGKCIDCGMCEEICSVHIPLRVLFKKVRDIVSETFDYTPGKVDGKSPFNMLGDAVEFSPRPL